VRPTAEELFGPEGTPRVVVVGADFGGIAAGSHLYSYSFKSHDWTRTHAKQAELQKYLEETVDEYGLRTHLRLGVAVESASWDDDRHVWTVRLDDGTDDECHVLISGVGFRVRTSGTLADGTRIDVETNTRFTIADGAIVGLQSDMDAGSVEAWKQVLAAGSFEVPAARPTG
jgi:hypothetical protein